MYLENKSCFERAGYKIKNINKIIEKSQLIHPRKNQKERDEREGKDTTENIKHKTDSGADLVVRVRGVAGGRGPPFSLVFKGIL